MSPDALPGKKVTVIGGARSGLAAARLLVRHGASVFLTERDAIDDRTAVALRQAKIAFEGGGHTPRALDADFFVISPGVPSTVNLVEQAERQRLPIYSEIEVASWFCPAPIVAVTGSNGKTTTTSLIAHLFRTAQRPFVVGGNIGYPFSDYVDDLTPDHAAVPEVSSFQLDHIDTFRPKVSVLLNITPDHLDRYNHDFNQYAQSKFRVFKNQRPGDWLVYNHDDELVREYVAMWTAKNGMTSWPFSIEQELERGAFVRDGQIVLALPESLDPLSPMIYEEELMPSSDTALRGRHNLYNSLAAAIAARAMEIRSDVVRQSLTSFEGVPHRLEKVRTLHGVDFINDSKATNVNAVWYALESFPSNVILIAGGRDKGNDYGPLKRLVEEKVKGLVALGESGEKVMTELGPYTPHAYRASSMEEAIQFARLMAEPGDTVLLSPACASFDMFDNYEHRGDTFKRLVQEL